MMSFITNYGGTILVGSILIVIVVAIIMKMRNDKKKGKTSCGCGCDGCPSANMCHKK